MPPRRADSPRPATSLTGTYPRSNSSRSSASWWSREPTRSSRGARGRSAGSIVCWRSDWTPATRIRARPFCHAIGDLRVPGDPDEALADHALGECRCQICLCPVRHRDEADVAADPSLVILDAPQTLAQARERTGRGEQRRQRRQVRKAMAAGLPAGVSRRFPAALEPARGGRRPGFRWRLRLRWLTARVLDLGVDRPNVEVDLLFRRRRRVSSGEVGRDLLGDASVPATTATERRVGHGSGVRLRWPDPTPAGARPADAIGVRRAVDLARRGDPRRVGGTQLEHVVAVGRLAGALSGPLLDRVGRRVEELVQSLLFVRRELGEDVVDGTPIGLADPHPQPAELLGLELVDDRAQAVVAACAATLAEPQLAEREREIVGDDKEVDERSLVPGEHLADR